MIVYEDVQGLDGGGAKGFLFNKIVQISSSDCTPTNSDLFQKSMALQPLPHVIAELNH